MRQAHTNVTVEQFQKIIIHTSPIPHPLELPTKLDTSPPPPRKFQTLLWDEYRYFLELHIGTRKLDKIIACIWPYWSIRPVGISLSGAWTYYKGVAVLLPPDWKAACNPIAGLPQHSKKVEIQAVKNFSCPGQVLHVVCYFNYLDGRRLAWSLASLPGKWEWKVLTCRFF